MIVYFGLLLFVAVTACPAAETVNFDSASIGSAPAGWTATKTGKGDPRWTVEKENDAPSKPNVLKQSGEATYPICLKNGSNVKDGFVEVKFKAISGKEDQAGGVVWRAKDADNYYIARANALEDTNGLRCQPTSSRVKVPRTLVGAALFLGPSCQLQLAGGSATILTAT